jgi:hypothetical protein
MVTGASNSDLAIVLIDARKGVLDQTRRHAAIASLLGIRDQRFSMRLSRALSRLGSDLSPKCNMLWISERHPTA